MESILCAVLSFLLQCGSGAPAPVAVPTPTAQVVPAAPANPPAAPTGTPVPAAPAAPPTSTPAPASPTPAAKSIALPPPAGQPELSFGPDSAKRKGLISLTFDAGSGNTYSPAILDQLKALNVKTTIFVTGEWAQANPELMRRIIADGHELGNHSYSHVDFTTITDGAMLQEMQRTDELAVQITGKSTKPWFRPPSGARNARVNKVIGDAGYYNVYWALDSTDWRTDTTSAQVLNRVLTQTTPGAIIVSHLTSQLSAETLTQQINGLRQRGFTLVPLSELFAEP